MKISLPLFLERRASARLLLAALCLCAVTAAFGQGNDNPTGVTGMFNGNSTTGGSYDPYTANATRTIPDITVAGAVGAYPLQWARTMNSRRVGTDNLGAGGGWTHSYQWKGTTVDSSTWGDNPGQYNVSYPDGRLVSFFGLAPAIATGPLGVGDRFQGISGTGYCYLLLSDGGKVRFHQTSTYVSEEKTWYFTITPPDQITDPYGLVTTLTYDTSGRLIQVTEPAGRWLKIYYNTSGNIYEVDAGYPSGPLTQTVGYSYAPSIFGGVSYTLLNQVNYSDEFASHAYYTYQPSNVSASGTPLISTCADVRYPGPMKNIAYDFQAGGSYGQLVHEKNFNGTVVVTLAINSATLRTETRGDKTPNQSLITRTFTYGAYAGSNNLPYLLKSSTDFANQTTTLAYDVNGFINSVTDPKQHTTTFTRLAATGAITKITHPSDAVTPTSNIQYFYMDPTTGYYLDHVTDELGHTTYYKRFANMTKSETDHPDGGVEQFTYNGFNQILTHTMVSSANGMTGGVETYTYDGRGLLQTYTPPATTSDPNPGAHPTRYTYDANDHLYTVTDPRGNVTTLGHNQIGQLTLVQHPDADHSLIGYGYNADGTLANVNVQYGPNSGDFALTVYAYDDYKRLLTVTSPVGNVTTYWYDKAGNGAADFTHTDANVSRLVLPSTSRVVKTVYDNNWRKIATTPGYGTSDAATTSYTYDAVGNLSTVTDPKANIWSYGYDARDRLLTVDDPTLNDSDQTNNDANSLGHTINYTYDLASNKKSEQRANNQTITYDSYDPMNRLLQMTVPQGTTPAAVSHYTWTRAGKLDTFTDPRNNLYNYDYDALNRLITTSYPTGGGTETRTYDFAGNLATFKNRAGAVQSFTYDTRNRETYNSWSTGSPLARTQVYDDASRITSCNTGTSASGTFINFTYYKDNTLNTQEEWGTGSYGNSAHRTLTYTYDADSRRASVQYQSGRTFSYDYTKRGQALHIYDPSAVPSTPFQALYTHDVNGNVTTRWLNGTTGYNWSDELYTYSVYDGLNRPTSAQHYLTGTSRWFQYGYDVMGNRRYEQRDWSSKGDGFQYDLANQITGYQREGTVTSSGTVTGPLNNDSLVFDANGNRTSVVDNGTTTTYAAANSLNQYPAVGGQSATYDANGNLITYNDGTSGYTFTYDAMNRLTSMSKGGTTANFYYDGLNRQVARTITGQPTYYSVWDGWDLAADYTASGLDAEYLHGGMGEMVLMTRSGVNTYFFQDGRGNTSQMSDANGNLIETYKYDLNGTPTVYDPNGNVISTGSTVGNRFMFGGQQWYASLSVSDLRNRFYLPSLGRFLQPDPIGFAGDPANLYRYCGNNPANGSDPMGLQEPAKVYNDTDPNNAPVVEQIQVTSTYLNDDPNAPPLGGPAISNLGVSDGDPTLTLQRINLKLAVKPLPSLPHSSNVPKPPHVMIAGMLPPGLEEIPFIAPFLESLEGEAAESASTFNPNNIGLSVGQEELQAQLLSNGFEQWDAYEGDNGPVSIFYNGQSFFTIYTRSNGVLGAQFFGTNGNFKFNLGGGN